MSVGARCLTWTLILLATAPPGTSTPTWVPTRIDVRSVFISTVSVADCPGVPKRSAFSASERPPVGLGARLPPWPSTNVRVSCEPSAKRAVTVTGQGLSASLVRDKRLPNTPWVAPASVAWTSMAATPPSELGPLAQPSTQAT